MILCLLLCRDIVAHCVSAHTSKALWSSHFIVSFLSLALLCISVSYVFLLVSFSCSQLVPDLTACLQLSCQLPSLETEVERGFSLFFFFLVKYSLHSYQTAWTECISTGKQLCDFGLTLKLLNIRFCFRRMFFLPFLNLCCLSTC